MIMSVISTKTNKFIATSSDMRLSNKRITKALMLLRQTAQMPVCNVEGYFLFQMVLCLTMFGMVTGEVQI